MQSSLCWPKYVVCTPQNLSLKIDPISPRNLVTALSSSSLRFPVIPAPKLHNPLTFS